MTRIITAIVSLVVLGSVGASGDEPSVTLRIEAGPDSVSVGDRVPVRFEILHPDTIEFAPIEGRVELGEVYLLGEGRKSGGPLGDSAASETLFAVVVPFRTGRVTLPPVKLAYETLGGLEGELASDSGFINVRSVLPENAADIKPLKANIPAPSELASYIILGVLACVLAASLILITRFIMRRKKPQQRPVETPPRPAHEIALEELQGIEEMRLLSQGRFKEYYSLISETVRRYAGNRYGFDTMDLTTLELVNELRRRRIEAPVGRLKDFLCRSDLVKFAKLVPPYGEMEEAIEVARDVVRSTMEVQTTEPSEYASTAEGRR